MRYELAPYALPDGYGESIIPLTAAKAHLHVDPDFDLDDDLIAAMRDASIDMVQKYCSVLLAENTDLIWKSDHLQSPLNLGAAPVQEITTITYVDCDGEDASMDVADVRIAALGEVKPAVGKSWPANVGGDVNITFTAGYAAGEIPSALIAAAKLFLGHLYANREAVLVGTIASSLPMGFENLCGLYRRPVI